MLKPNSVTRTGWIVGDDPTYIEKLFGPIRVAAGQHWTGWLCRIPVGDIHFNVTWSELGLKPTEHVKGRRKDYIENQIIKELDKRIKAIIREWAK